VEEPVVENGTDIEMAFYAAFKHFLLIEYMEMPL